VKSLFQDVEMPHFSLKTLLESVALIAAGIPIAMWGALTPEGGVPIIVLLGAVALGGAMIGVGALRPFNRPVLGAVLVPAVLFALGFGYLFYQAMQL
jgi:hypothetical protein